MALFKGENPSLGDNVTINGSKPSLIDTITFPLAANTVSQTVFINGPVAYKLVGARVTFTASSTSGTVAVEVLPTAGQASGSGTALLTAPISLSGAAYTPVSGTLATTAIPAKARVGIVIAGTMTGLGNGIVQLSFQRA